MISLDPSPAEITRLGESANSRRCLDKTACIAVAVFLARRLKAANPDAKHPGKAGEQSFRGKLAFPPADFPGFLWARSLQIFVIPAWQAEAVGISNGSIRQVGCKG